MTRYSPAQLSSSARLLHVLAVVVTCINVLASAVGALVVALYLGRLAPTWVAVGGFIVTFAIGTALAMLLTAPLHLLVETSLCNSAMEEHMRLLVELLHAQTKLHFERATEEHRAA